MSTSSERSRIAARYSLDTTQTNAVIYCLDRLYTLLVAPKGKGKTRMGLAVAAETEGRTLIVCPAKVKSGWVEEGLKHGLQVHILDGDAKRRELDAINPTKRFCVISADLLPWLYKERLHGEFDGLIIDETSRFSTAGNKGVKALRHAHKLFDWVLGLTANPVMEKPLALYGQALVIDGGASLGTRFDRFKQTYFFPEDFEQRKWSLQPGAEDRLARAVADLVCVVSEDGYEDSLAELKEQIIHARGHGNFWRHYDTLIDDLALEIDGEDVEAANEAVLSGKLEQLTQGGVYKENGNYKGLNRIKEKRLHGLVASADGPVVIVYCFIFELEMLRKLFPHGRDLKDTGALEAFQFGDLDVLFMHPRSGSHGLNLQYRCHEMICLKPFWSADGWDQVIGRIRRRGQPHPWVRRRTLVIPGSIDEIILDRIQQKADTAQSVMEHIKRRSGACS